MMEEMIARKLLGLAAVAANSAAADLAAAGVESEEEEEDTCSWSRDGSGDTASYEEGGSEDDEEDERVGGKRKMSPDDRKTVAADRKARNRERNRLHARKTRQRKKQHVQELQLKIWGLRQERQRLLQLSTDHRTAGVLLALSCSPKQCHGAAAGNQQSPRRSSSLKLPRTAAHSVASRNSSSRDWNQEVASHEDTLRKITQEFESMDGSQQVGEDEEAATHIGSGGGKGGSRGVKGTLSDRTALRRERNRMHAKRTRNRKKLFVEACSVMIDKMKVENAQLENEIRASGIQLPEDNWAEEVRETIPEEPLPEYLAALWDFAEGKSHSPKAPGSGVTASSMTTTATPVSPPATPRIPPAGAFRQTRQTSSSSSSSTFSCATSVSSSSCSSSFSSTNSRRRLSSAATTKVSSRPPSPPSAGLMAMSVLSEQASKQPAAAVGAADRAATSTPGQALEDASALCAFMEAAQTRSAKRVRVAPPPQRQYRDGSMKTESAKQMQTQPRGWSDHGSTTSESRGGSDVSEEDTANERKSADGSGASALSSEEDAASSRKRGAVMPPEFWTSRQVLERYVLPRQPPASTGLTATMNIFLS